jgi:uncharacterized protein
MTHGICLRAVVVALGLVAAAGVERAKAQSFDCEATSGAAEAMICGDAALQQLDEDMAAAYGAAQKSATDRRALAQAQRAWLVRRDSCKDVRCVADAYRTRLGVIARKPVGTVTYHNAGLGISFDHPADRYVAPCENTPGPSCVGLWGAFDGGVTELVAFQVFDGALEAVAADQAGFELRDSKWMTSFGRFAPNEVELFTSGALQGMRATVTCGISDRTGFHAAGGECLYVVVSNGKRSVMASTDGLGGNDAASARTIASVRFDR